MQKPTLRKITALLGIFLLVWLGLRYALPLVMPFLLGTLLALAAEPLVRTCTVRGRLPRPLAAGIGVSLTLVLLVGLFLLLCSVLVKELGSLAGVLPNMEDTARQGISLLEDSLLTLADQTPEGVRPLVTRSVTNLFGSGTAIMDQASKRLTGMATGFLSQVPDGALTAGTAVISAFMISARLPALGAWIRRHLPNSLREQYIPAFRNVRASLAGWLKAQVKLSGVSFLIITLGLVLLQVPYAPVWALLTALVDALPLLGSGTVLLPWALISVLQGDTVRAIGLGAIYTVAALTRSALEPRLVGKQLGLDPLITLMALYVGYQLWGLLGMLLAPILAVTATELAQST